jgi:hypothetical protein
MCAAWVEFHNGLPETKKLANGLFQFVLGKITLLMEYKLRERGPYWHEQDCSKYWETVGAMQSGTENTGKFCLWRKIKY